jgi:predicted O-linked N-acetylglucosamine transferase (SPINDLY family)
VAEVGGGKWEYWPASPFISPSLEHVIAMSIQESLELALKHHRLNRLAEAEAIYRQVLSEHPDHPGALHLHGVLSAQTARADLAVDLIGRAIAANPKVAVYHLSMAKALGTLGRREEMTASLRRALEQDPTLAEAKFNLANELLHNDKPEEAAELYLALLSKDPKFAQAWNNLGSAHRALGQNDEATKCFCRALEVQGDFADARFNLGNLHMDEGRWSEAIAELRRAIAVKPDFVEAYNNLAALLGERGMVAESIEAAQKAVALRPKYGKAYNNLANALKKAGLFGEAFGPMEKAVNLLPDDAVARGVYIHALLYRPGVSAEEILREERRWNELHAMPLAGSILPHANDRNPHRRLRIGYVSADFCDHIAGLNLLPLLRQHDQQAFEIFCYSNTRKSDPTTELFKPSAKAWREIARLNDESAARIVRDDRIDILMDLSLHTAGNRLQLFARKPAPEQATFIGYPGSTGLSAIDYRLTDPHLDPVGQTDQFYSEESIRLENSFWCYDPVAMQVLDYPVDPLPSLSSGTVTFGSLNNLGKINDSVLELWAKVLRAVPKARLIVAQVTPWARPWILQKLQKQGVDLARVECVPRLKRADYFKCFGRVDLCLDTFPYNGHTTSLDSFWMGVPCVTLIGSTVVGRAGYSQLCNLGLKELAASTPEEYVRIASELAGDLPRLAEIRRGLRERMRNSPLCDAAGFARSVEKAYRQMWRRWCEKKDI